MNRPLKLLVIDDSPDESARIVSELRGAGYVPEFRRVDCREGLIQALGEGRWDLAICDLSMPTFSGVEAVSLAKEYGEDLPVIIVTKAESARWAAPLMRVGARDFVEKGDLSRLPLAVERELDYALRHRIQKKTDVQLQSSREELASLLESLPVVCYRMGAIGERAIHYISPNVHEVSGFASETFLRDPSFRTGRIHPEDAPVFLREEAQLARKRVCQVEYRWRVADGSYEWFRDHMRLVEGEDGNPNYVVGTWKCVSDVKGIELELLESRKDLENRVAQRTAELKTLNEQLARSVEDLRVQNSQVEELHALGKFLQACHTVEEAYDLLAKRMGRVFPGTSGTYYAVEEGRTELRQAASWGLERATESFAADDCWAMRCGRPHAVGDDRSDMLCLHLNYRGLKNYVCVPVTVESKTIGLLHVACRVGGESDPVGGSASQRLRLAPSVAEQAGLSIRNIELRRRLREESIRDPLSGVYNRRYLDETLAVELRRASRSGKPVSIVLFDIDHFKRFNDSYGHDAGDLVIREFGHLLERSVRGGDVVARFGGEEFVLIMPEAPLEVACRRAEELREETKKLALTHLGKALGQVTVSAGVATRPAHGETREHLFQAADAALYRAKEGGRDQVEVAS